MIRLVLIATLLILSSCIEPVPPEEHTVVLEAEDAEILDVFTVRSDSSASSGAYLTQPPSVENTQEGVESATLTVTVPTRADYTLWVRMYGPSTREDAAYAGIGELVRVYPSETQRYEWVEIGVYDLRGGEHTISIGHAESNTRIDLFVMSTEPHDEVRLETYVKRSFTAGDPDDPVEPRDEPSTERDEFSLRANPDFDPEYLTPEGRIWHARLINGFESQDGRYLSSAGSDNLYNYGRTVHTHVQSLLWALRATGDVRILDEVDRSAEAMRATLSDSWCASSPDPRYNYESPDGYVNWRWRGSSNTHNCRDVHRLDESKTHGLIATIAYAYEMNRDLESPNGIDYAERADFWTDYLFNVYEKKWQDRMGRDDALTRVNGFNSGHAQLSNIKMHYYLYRLSGDGTYLDRSNAMSDQVLEGLRIAPSPNGDAYVWARRWSATPSDSTFILQPSTYVRYVLADFAEFHVEGIGPWDDPSHMPRFANTLTQFIMDDGSNSFARDVGGGVERAGIPATSEEDWNRFDRNRYSISPYVNVIAWDTTGTGAEISEDVYRRTERDHENPNHLYIPAGMLFTAEWNAR